MSIRVSAPSRGGGGDDRDGTIVVAAAESPETSIAYLEDVRVPDPLTGVAC